MQKEKIVQKVRKKEAILYPIVKINSKSKKLTILSEEGSKTLFLSAIPWGTPLSVLGVTLKRRRLSPEAVLEFKKGLNIQLDGQTFDGYQVPIPD